MSQGSIMTTRFQKAQIFLIAFTLLVFTVNAAQAQSGRRAPKRAEPVATPTPEPTPEVPREQPKPEIQKTRLSVMRDDPMTLNLMRSYPDIMQNWIVERLRKSGVLDVGVGAHGNRSEAAKRAKKETETFTVLLQLEEDSLAGNSSIGSRTYLRNMAINYVIYSPQTGKQRQSGTVPLSAMGSTGVLGGARTGITCYPGVYGEELLLLRASIEVADRIMSNFSAPIPGICSAR